MLWVWVEGSNLLDQPIYQQLRLYQERRDIIATEKMGEDVANAYSFVAVLSIPYLLDNQVPRLADALDGNP